MMDEFIDWPTPYFQSLATCDELLVWMIEIRMENHLVSDNTCNIAIYIPKKIQGMTYHLGLTFSVGDTISWFTISLEQDN
jgi:hypothetical protein